MEKLRAVYRYLREKYDLLSLKKYNTIAGTLVFFLIMSIVPFSFWMTLIIGRLPIDTGRVLSLSVFDSVKDILLYVQKEATNATASASIILIFTTLYSSTNLFYQMRRSGEIIYDFHRERQGLRLRVGALVLLIIVMASVVTFLLIFALGSFLFSRLLSGWWAKLADYLLLTAVAFFLVLLLNMYICPYKTSVRNFLFGTVITVVAWVGAVIGFSVYLRISNVNRLYGALSTIIVFLLWLYILMICFVVGVILNSEKILAQHGIKGRLGRGKKSRSA
ncbi:MAG: YihY/virulence factor BrkB family protein [Clostridia bacterium]|nr:YihY/virulence factor BrkB family protein [Clostridia bacterium]